MPYKRDPDLPFYVRDSDHPATKFTAYVFAFAVMPFMIGIAWWKAAGFDPYTAQFLTRDYIEPTADMPDEMRLAAWVLIAISGLILLSCINGLARARVTFRETWIVLWIGVCIAAFGSAFFVAADRAQERIEQEMAVEAGKT